MWNDVNNWLVSTFPDPVLRWSVYLLALGVLGVIVGALRKIGANLIDRVTDRSRGAATQESSPNSAEAGGVVAGRDITGSVNTSNLDQREQTVAGDLIQGNATVSKTTVNIDKQIVMAAVQDRPDSLHQIPPAPGDFTGRGAELARLHESVNSGNVTISGLRGMGGVGKTALALKFAEELAPKYPDAQIFLDLRGPTKDPIPAAKAMEHVIRAFHPDAKLPEDPAQLV